MVIAAYKSARIDTPGLDTVLDKRTCRALDDNVLTCRWLIDPSDYGVFGSDLGYLAEYFVDKGFVENVRVKAGTVV